jgi:branched-chain amino acid transport system ATP-binding protein
LPKAEIATRVADMLALVKLETFGLRKPHQLSGGQRQRVALARSLVKRPRVLLLDEPMAGLGIEESRAMSKLLASLKRQCTILLIEHDMDAVFSLADRISVLVGGRIVASGTADEIRNHPGVRVAYLGEEDDVGDFRADG